jgi:XTP/dITP diphosphohydrolase
MMGFPPRIAIASRNPGKVREILQICTDWPVEWVTDASAWPDVEETGSSYLENARLKAEAIGAAAGLAALAEDSGIEVDALGGAPGLRSARFAGEGATDAENLEQLVARIRGASAADRTARYRCVAVCTLPDGSEIWAEGTCQGRLILEPRGTGGFGYDPIFVPAGEERSAGAVAGLAPARTMAQLTDAEKNAISHRGKALRALRDKLAAD